MIAVEDFNLTDQRLVMPCAATTLKRERYTAPWFLALTGGNTQQLFRLTASCTATGTPTTTSVTAYDVMGNKTTVTQERRPVVLVSGRGTCAEFLDDLVQPGRMRQPSPSMLRTRTTLTRRREAAPAFPPPPCPIARPPP